MAKDRSLPRRRNPVRKWVRETFVDGWYSPDDPTARDRCRHLTCNYTANIIANLIGGTFWTGLLLLLNAGDSFIGTVTMISTAANMLQLFSPLILERFPSRRRLLTVPSGRSSRFAICSCGNSLK